MTAIRITVDGVVTALFPLSRYASTAGLDIVEEDPREVEDSYCLLEHLPPSLRMLVDEDWYNSSHSPSPDVAAEPVDCQRAARIRNVVLATRSRTSLPYCAEEVDAFRAALENRLDGGTGVASGTYEETSHGHGSVGIGNWSSRVAEKADCSNLSWRELCQLGQGRK